MEKRPLLKSQNADYGDLPPTDSRNDGRGARNDYGTSGDVHSGRRVDVMVNCVKGDSYDKPTVANNGRSNHHQKSRKGDGRRRDVHDRSLARDHHSCAIQTPDDTAPEDWEITPDASGGKGPGKTAADGEEEEAEEMLVSRKDQRKRMVLLGMIGFLAACAGNIYTPLITQYTYQVYTEKLFGNLSDGMDVSKQPCVSSNASGNAALAQQVQDQSAAFLARMEMIDGGISMVVNLFLGSYSDFVGRRLALLLPMLGHFLRIGSICVVIFWDIGLPGVFVGYILDGMFGGFAGLIMGLYSYSADVTQRGSERTVGTTIVSVTINLGMAALNILGGLLIQDTGFFYSALAATVVELICVVLVMQLPETVPRDWKTMVSPWKAVWRVVRVFVPRGDHLKQALLLLSLAGFFINTMFLIGAVSLEPLYQMDHPFCWSSLSQGVWGSAAQSSGQLTVFLLVKLLRNLVSAPVLAIMGVLSELGKDIMMGLARNNLQMYMVILVGICKDLFYPAMRSFMSSLVPRNKQGAMFAGIAILESVCQCVGPMITTMVYTATLSFFAGFAFLTMAASQVVVITLCLIVYCLNRKYIKRHVTPFNVQSDVTQTDDVHDCCATHSSTADNRHSV